MFRGAMALPLPHCSNNFGTRIRREALKVKAAASNKNNGTTMWSGSTLVEERIGTKLVRRYTITQNSLYDVHQSFDSSRPAGDDLRQATLDFILPAGFPDSVSKDYLRYMLWQLPTNITAWICRALITSSLLQAVGISAGPGPTAAATAAIKWVTKDGLGAIGRLFIGGRFGGVFDEDPKQWRMYAEFVGSFGGIFELVTPLAPDYFLPLASLGHLTKAIARGLKDPSFRVFQNHFAISENVGDVSAKEEVWEVAGQLVGLALGVVLLSSPAVASSYTQLALSWTLIRSFHLWLRYQSLATLELPTLNYKRLTTLIVEHIQGLPLSGISECNQKENLILPRALLKPVIRIGCRWEEVLRPGSSGSDAKRLLDVHHSEDHVLGVHDGEVLILLKQGWTNLTVLRSMYQAHCIFLLDSQEEVSSLKTMQKSFAAFTDDLVSSGWNVDKLVVKVSPGAPVYSFLEKEEESE